MPLPSAFTLVCPANDLESLRILDLAHTFRSSPNDDKHLGIRDIEILVGPASWGNTLDDSVLRLWSKDGGLGDPFSSSELLQRTLNDYLVIITLPSPWLVDRLKQKNPQLNVIEIGDGAVLNGYRGPQLFSQSVLQQFAQLIGVPFTKEDHYIATNAAHYLPGLVKLGLSRDALNQVRNTELAIRGITGLGEFDLADTSFVSSTTIALLKQPDGHCNFERIADIWYCSNCGLVKNPLLKRSFKDITFVHAPEEHSPVLMELLHRNMGIADVDSNTSSVPLSFSLGNTLIFYYDNDAYSVASPKNLKLENVIGVEFSGDAKYRNRLNHLCMGENFTHFFLTQTGGSEYGAYCIARLKQATGNKHFSVESIHLQRQVLTQFISELLTEVMTFSRPLRDYQGTFFLPLDFSDENDHIHTHTHTIKTTLSERGWQEFTHTRYSLDDAKTQFTEKENNGKAFNEYCREEIINKAFAFKTKVYAQEYFYFEPQLRQFLYTFTDNDHNSEPHIQTWQYLPKDADPVQHEHFLGRLRLILDDNCDTPYIEAFVSDVKLHLMSGQLFILEINTKSVFTAVENSDVPPCPAEYYFPHWSIPTNSTKIGDRGSLTNIQGEAHHYVPRQKLSTDFDTEDWWLDMVFGDEKALHFYQQAQMGYWLQFSNSFRLLFTAYSAHAKERGLPEIIYFPINSQEGKITNKRIWSTKTQNTDKSEKPNVSQIFIPSPEDSNKLLSPLIEYWLEKIVKIKDTKDPNHAKLLQNAIKNSHDDRLFAQLSYCPAGTAPESFTSETLDPYFTYALYLDNSGFSAMDGFAYDPAFLQTTSAQQYYRRWKKNGVLSGFTDFSNVYMGYGWFFDSVIAKEHIPHHYRRMLILALFYRTTLRNYSRAIDQASKALTEDKKPIKNTIEGLRKNFIRFTTKYWFENITAQIQGQELFTLIKQNLGLQQEYEFIKEQMNWADGYLKDQYNKVMQKLANILASLAAFIALFAVGLDSMNFIFPSTEDTPISLNLIKLVNLFLVCFTVSYFFTMRFITRRILEFGIKGAWAILAIEILTYGAYMSTKHYMSIKHYIYQYFN